MARVARLVFVGHGEGSGGDDPAQQRSERRSVQRRLDDAAFADAFERAPGVLLVLAMAQVVSAVWLGALQQRGAVLLASHFALGIPDLAELGMGALA